MRSRVSKMKRGREERSSYGKRKEGLVIPPQVLTPKHTVAQTICIFSDKPVKRLLSKNTLFPSTSGVVKLNVSASLTLQPHCCVAMVPTLI